MFPLGIRFDLIFKRLFVEIFIKLVNLFHQYQWIWFLPVARTGIDYYIYFNSKFQEITAITVNKITHMRRGPPVKNRFF